LPRAAIMPGPGQSIEVRTLAEPELEPGSVLLKTNASEVCGTDVHLWHGRLAGVPYPLIPGHVSVGEVAATGGDVFDVEAKRIEPGQVVTFLDVHETCHHCLYCTALRTPNRCPHRKVYGITYGADEGLLGGWSEQIYLKPGVLILPLASNVSPDQWMGGGCGLPTAMHAVELARINLGERVIIQGSGPVGLSACALALLSGAGFVGVIGSPEFRLEAARRFGADWTMDVSTSTEDERVRAVRDATGGIGPDIVIEASGNPRAVREGMEMVRDGGRYIVVGQYTDNGPVEVNPHLHINRKHLEIRGCWGTDFAHVWRSMQVLSRFGSRMDWSHLITTRYSLAEAGNALADVENLRVVKALIDPRM
jgi:threonine dehydrogenase-like Zn-dependent dehydrogenase